MNEFDINDYNEGEIIELPDSYYFNAVREGDWLRLVAKVEDKEKGIIKDNIYGRIKKPDNIFNKAIIEYDAIIYENAMVFRDALVCDNAAIYGKAKVFDKAKVCDKAEVFGNAWVCDDAK